MADLPELTWELVYGDVHNQPIAWYAEHGDYWGEVEFVSGSTLPRSWEVRHSTDELVRCGTARSLSEAKTAATRAIQEVCCGRDAHN